MTVVREMEVGPDLYVMILSFAELKEQDVNAQIMQPRHMERLTENVRGRGALEQLPYCSWPNRKGPVSIVSGHHRVRAARGAGLNEGACLVDTLEFTRSEIVAKQVAHNEIHGTPDELILRQLISMIDNVDDLLATGLPEGWVPSVGTDDTQLGLPHADFKWHTVSLVFLSRQLEDVKAALESADPAAELTGVADLDQFEDFATRVIDFGRSHNIRSVSAAVAVLAGIARRETQEAKARKEAGKDGPGQAAD